MTSQRQSSRSFKTGITTLCILLVMSGNLFANGADCPVFDEFQDVQCEDLAARLDNFSNQLNNDPTTNATIMVYEGKYSKGRNPRVGEAQANAARIQDYLVGTRGIDQRRISIVKGGYREHFTVQLYACPSGITPTAAPTVGGKVIRFRRARVLRREYKWSCL